MPLDIIFLISLDRHWSSRYCEYILYRLFWDFVGESIKTWKMEIPFSSFMRGRNISLAWNTHGFEEDLAGEKNSLPDDVEKGDAHQI